MTKFGMTPKQRDIVLVPVPFTDLSSKKRRPVVVLSNSEHNRIFSDFVAAAITSNVYERDYTIPISQNNLEEGLLKVPSMILMDKIYTLSREIIVHKFGRINITTFKEMVDVVKRLVGGPSE